MWTRDFLTWVVVVLCACGVAAAQGAQIIYVDGAAVGADDGSSWTDAYRYLQDALVAAALPAEIRVARGTYKPDQGSGVVRGDPNAAFALLDGITLKGGYAGVGGVDPDARDVAEYASVLSGSLGALDDLPLSTSNQVVTANLTDATAVIDGFSITGWFSDGIHIDAGSPTVRNCTFESTGYGLSIRDGSPSVIDCRFFDYINNGINASDCNSVLTRCVFDRRGIEFPSFLAAILCEKSDLRLTDCTFTGSGGGSVYVAGTLDLVRCSFVDVSSVLSTDVVRCSGALTASDCVFHGNRVHEVVSARGDAEFVGCRFIDNSGTAVIASGTILRATRCVFSGNSHSGGRDGAAISNLAPYMELSHCLFAGNSDPAGRFGAIFDTGWLTQISHCTFAGNRGEPSAINLDFGTTLTQCIVWDCPSAFEGRFAGEPQGTVTYSNVQGGFAGVGNIDVDPCFVDPGYWDANGTADDSTDDIWVTGDYHLKSQAGHWDAESESWVLDDVTSACIDAGDPNAPIEAEPFPNGGYANLGAYGGTAEASRTYFGGPVCTTQVAGDINGDCKVDDLDMEILLSHWLMDDIGRINAPPTVKVASPLDGAELSRPEPITIQVETSDPDGRVIYVSYVLTYGEEGGYNTSGVDFDPGQSWGREHPWSHVPYDGVYVLQVEAIDNDGAKTVSEVQVTLHP